ncbi:hypothetical protein AADV15_001621 [Campylobacter coli]
MQLIDGYYTDFDNNKWDSSRYTEEQAREASESLVFCKDCLNCFNLCCLL